MTRHGSTIRLGSHTQRTILAALLVRRGAVVSVDRLVDALWGDRPPETALESLRTHVYRLRRALHGGGARECLFTRPPGYVLDVHPDAVDAGRFERLVAEARDESPRRPEDAAAALQESLALWRGQAFAEFADAEFAAPEAARLEDLRLAATEDLFDLKLTLGRHAEVVAESEAFTAENPWRERAHEQLIIALYRCGQQTRALDVYRDLRERLDRELGLEPSQRLRALENAVLQHSPDLAWEPRRTTDRAAGGAGRRAGRLPWERTSFVGRSRETAEVVAALHGHRVVCLVGAGGVGKSRLALRAAREAADHYADGAWWCDLAAVAAPEAVLDGLAASLGVLHRTGESVESSVLDFLAGRQALLVMDNCEHVAEETTRLLEALVDRCPQVTVLATSRVALDVTGARTWTVEPLPVTETDDGEVEPAAVRLFLERARTVRAGLEHETADLAHIVEICRRLDGLPLAIELAAARMRSLNAADIAGRLDDRFRLLTQGPEARLARQSTLRAVVDWSFDLLSVAERRLFERLSVFAGEFTPEAAEQVCNGHPIEQGEIVDLLGRLVDASMVTVGPPQGEVSYRLLETLRAYGREHLAASGDLDRYRQAHARYYASLAGEAARGVRGPDEAAWVDRIDRDLANFREAHRWAIANVDVDVAMQLSVSLFRYAVWRLRDEVLRWAEETVDLAGAETHALWPAACGVAGWGCGLRGQRVLALRLAERGLAAAPRKDPGRITLLEVQAHVALWEGRLDDCIDVMDRAAELATDPYELMPWTVRALALAYAGRTDDALATAEHARYHADRLGNPTMMGLARYSVAEALMERDPDAAAPVLDQAIELAGRVRNRMVLGVAGVSSAALRARHGDPAVALRSSAAVLEVWAQTSDWTHLWVGLRSLAELLARVGADRTAAVLLGAVLDGSTGPPVYGADAERLAELAAALEDRLGAGDLAAARSRGQAMAAAEVLDFARGEIDQAAANL